MSLIDYIQDYYLPLMEIDDTIPCIKTLFLAIQDADKKGISTSYTQLIDHIKSNINPEQYPKINLHFNRMKFQIQEDCNINLEFIQFYN